MTTDNPQQPGKTGKDRGFGQQFESFLEGSLRLIGRFFETPWSLVRCPQRVAEAFLTGKGHRHVSSLPPLTFLFASAFLFTFVASSYSSYPLKGYRFEEAFERILQSFGPDLSLVRVFLLALPISLAALLGAYVVDLLTSRKTPRLQRVAFLTYVTSFQMFAFFLFSLVVVAVILAFGPYPYPGELAVGGTDKCNPHALFQRGFSGMLVLLCLVVSIGVPWVLIKVTRAEWNVRQRRWMTLLMAALVQLPGLFALSAAAALDVLPSLLDKQEVTPLTLVEQRFRRVPGGAEIHFKVLIENKENYAVMIVDRGRDSMLSFRWPLAVQPTPMSFEGVSLHVIDSPESGSPFVEIPPMGRSWVVLGGHLDHHALQRLERAVNSKEKRELIALSLRCKRGTKLGGRGSVYYELKVVPEI
jgi:hypothetical protein